MMKNQLNFYKVFILTLLVNFVFYCNLYAQNGKELPINISQPQIVPVSPEAAAVQKYVCYPVNHSTGLADISIPIYTIKVGDLELPITLSYHSGGIKLRQLSGWVGTNWTLNAEPSIMREIRGIPDDEKYGGYLTARYFNEREQSDPDKKTRFLKQVEDKIIDSEPDRFYYKLANQSGTFYLGVESKGAKPVTRVCACYPRPYVPINVTGWEVLGPNELDITDESGVRYEFGSESDGYTEKTGNYNTRWLCRRIVSNQTKAKLSFKYSEFQSVPIISSYPSDYVVLEDYPGYLRSGEQKPDSDCFTIKANTFLARSDSSISARNYTVPSGSYRLIAKQGSHTSYYRIEDGEAEIVGSYYNFEEYLVPNPYFATSIQERKLTSINFDNGSVLFEQGGGMNLSSITVKSIDGRIIRKVQFYITSYNANTSLTKLDSIVVTSGTSSSERRVYSFRYKNPYNVQSEASYAIDHWGYYNGQHGLQDGSRMFIPYGRYYCNDGYYFNFGDSARNCNEACMQVGILTDIFSPEGVHTNFTYAANRYGKRFSAGGNYAKCEYLAGGLRVQRIREEDLHSSFSRTRTFFYALSKPREGDENFKDGLGVPKVALTERDYCAQMERLTIKPLIHDEKLCRLRTWGSMPVSNITYGNGNSVIYPYVMERVFTGTSTEESRTEYYFSAPDWELHGGIPNDPFAPSQVRQDITKPFEPDDGWDALRYGQLMKKEIYEDATLLERHEYEYSIYNEPSRDTGIQKVICGRPYKTRACNIPEYDSYPQEIYQDYTWGIQPGVSRLKRERITRFSDRRSLKGQIETRDYVYCPDDQDDQFDSGVSMSVLSATKHLNPLRIRTTIERFKVIERFTYPEEAKDSLKDDLGQDWLLKNHALNKLLVYKHIFRTDTTTLRNVYSGLSIQAVQAWNPVLSKYEDRLRYTYTPYGNVRSVTSDGSTTCYLWSYYNQSPVFKMENITVDQLIRATQGDSWIGEMEGQGAPTNLALSKMKLLQETSDYRGYSYTYRPLVGVTSIKGPDGITTYFEYDGFGRLIDSYILEDNIRKTIATFDYNTPSH